MDGDLTLVVAVPAGRFESPASGIVDVDDGSARFLFDESDPIADGDLVALLRLRSIRTAAIAHAGAARVERQASGSIERVRAGIIT